MKGVGRRFCDEAGTIGVVEEEIARHRRERGAVGMVGVTTVRWGKWGHRCRKKVSDDGGLGGIVSYFSFLFTCL